MRNNFQMCIYVHAYSCLYLKCCCHSVPMDMIHAHTHAHVYAHACASQHNCDRYACDRHTHTHTHTHVYSHLQTAWLYTCLHTWICVSICKINTHSNIHIPHMCIFIHGYLHISTLRYIHISAETHMHTHMIFMCTFTYTSLHVSTPS